MNSTGIMSYARQIDAQHLCKARVETSYVGMRYNSGWEAAVSANNRFNRQTSLEDIMQLRLANPSFNRAITSQPLTIGVDFSYRY